MNAKFKQLQSKAFRVGGNVRDEFLGLPCSDEDYVVEATEEQFRAVFPDAPFVGKDFPVFLVDGEDTALTRTEKSTGSGYGDFELDKVGVSIEEDLGRRDFTINSMARRMDDDSLVDPFNGAEDLANGILRTVFSQAFEEDPVRILRGARLAARFGFKFEEQTFGLMYAAAPLLTFVTKERIALEFEKMYKSAEKPSVFFRHLANLDALKHIVAPLDALRFVPAGPVQYHGKKTGFAHTMEVIDRCKANGYSFKVFMGALAHDFGKATTVPN